MGYGRCRASRVAKPSHLQDSQENRLTRFPLPDRRSNPVLRTKGRRRCCGHDSGSAAQIGLRAGLPLPRTDLCLGDGVLASGGKQSFAAVGMDGRAEQTIVGNSIPVSVRQIASSSRGTRHPGLQVLTSEPDRFIWASIHEMSRLSSQVGTSRIDPRRIWV